MFSFVARRVLQMIPVLLAIATLTFFMIRLAPGGPFDAEKNVSPEIRKNLESYYGMNKPVYQQYFDYLGRLVQGDLGPSFKYSNWTVNELIAQSFPVSAELACWSLLIALLFGLPGGNHRLAAAEHAHRLHPLLARAHRDFDSQLRPRSLAGPGLRAQSRICSRFRLGRLDGSHSAFDHARRPVCRLHRAPHPRRHARDFIPGFHSHRARERRLAVARDLETWIARRPAAGGQLSRAGRRRPDDRLICGRDDFPNPGPRPLFRQRGFQSRLHHAARAPSCFTARSFFSSI